MGLYKTSIFTNNLKFCTRSYGSCVYHMMRFKGSNGKVSKMMTSHFRTRLSTKFHCPVEQSSILSAKFDCQTVLPFCRSAILCVFNTQVNLAVLNFDTPLPFSQKRNFF